jgi:hypothetical protein
VISKFSDIHRAIIYLREGLFSPPCPGAWADIAWCPDGKSIRESLFVPEQELRPNIEKFCKRFSEATVILIPGNPGFPMGAMQCRCHHDVWRLCPQACPHHADRPLVCVFACSAEKRPSHNEKAAALHTWHEKANQHHVEESHLRDRHSQKGHHRH